VLLIVIPLLVVSYFSINKSTQGLKMTNKPSTPFAAPIRSA
jgi:hypothetical protein